MPQMITDLKFRFNYEFVIKVCYSIKSDTIPIYKYAYITVRSENEYSALMTAAVFIVNGVRDCDRIDWTDTYVMSCHGYGTSSKVLGSVVLEARF